MEKISFRNNVLPLKNILYRLALRITQSEEDAKDIVQDTLLKVWDKKDEWNEIESIEALSMTICRDLALDRIKSKTLTTNRSKIQSYKTLVESYLH